MERNELPRYCSDEPKWLHPLLSVTLIVSPCMYLPDSLSVSPCFSLSLPVSLSFSPSLSYSLALSCALSFTFSVAVCLPYIHPLSLAAAKPSKARGRKCTWPVVAREKSRSQPGHVQRTLAGAWALHTSCSLSRNCCKASSLAWLLQNTRLMLFACNSSSIAVVSSRILIIFV